MRKNLFLERYESINKNLAGEVVSRAFNSIGFHIFFDLGEVREATFPNGKETTDCDWTIWVGNASWRISRKGKYVAGSGDSSEEMDAAIQQIVGKKFQSMHIISSFLDALFRFEGGYELRTFFNWRLDEQWTVIMPKKESAEVSTGLDCSSSSKRKQAREIAKLFTFSEKYQQIPLPQTKAPLVKIEYDKRKMPFLHFENGFVVYLKSCAWRLEKEGEFITGCLDDTEKEQTTKLKQLLGKKLKRIDTLNLFLDARIEFEEGYVLKTFCCVGTKTQWTLSLQDEVIFEANIFMEQNAKLRKKKSATLAKADS